MGQGNVFTPVCHSVHGGFTFPQWHGRKTPQKADPPSGGIPPQKVTRRRQTPLTDTINQRAVCILLECILV